MSKVAPFHCRQGISAGQGGAIVLLVSTNLSLVYHYLGSAVAGIYLLCYLGLILWVWRWSLPERVERILLATVVVASVLVQIFAVHRVAPLFDARMDRDDALSCWLAALRRGDYPYAEPTSGHNPISVFPFLPIMAWPFDLMGNVGYLPVFSYLVLVILLWATYRHARLFRFFTICVLSSAPLLLFEVSGRSDVIANMLLFVLVIHWLERHEGRPWGWEAYVFGALFGCLVATRLGLLLTIGVVALYLLHNLPFRTAVQMGIAALAAFSLLVVPFIVWDPATFFHYAPMGVSSTKLGDSTTAQVGWSVATLLVALASGLVVRRARHLYAALVPTLALITVATWLTFFRDWTYLQFIFVPLLFALPRSEPQEHQQGAER